MPSGTTILSPSVTVYDPLDVTLYTLYFSPSMISSDLTISAWPPNFSGVKALSLIPKLVTGTLIV